MTAVPCWLMGTSVAALQSDNSLTHLRNGRVCCHAGSHAGGTFMVPIMSVPKWCVPCRWVESAIVDEGSDQGCNYCVEEPNGGRVL